MNMLALCKLTAFQFWKHEQLSHHSRFSLTGNGVCVCDDFAAPPTSAVFTANSREVLDLCSQTMGSVPLPVTILVTSDKARRNSRSVKCSLLPPGLVQAALVQTAPHLAVATPEYIFLQMATDLSFYQLLALGYRLLARYVENPFGGEGQTDSSFPLTTVRRMHSLAERCEGAPGIKKARRALKYVQQGSRSPRESALAAILTLPHVLGGYHLPGGELNPVLHPYKSQSPFWQDNDPIPDILFREAKTIVEYDGVEGHSSFLQKERDDMRKNRLVAAGYRPITVTKSQYEDVEALDKTARQIARLLHKRLPPTIEDPKWLRANRELKDAFDGR